MSYVLVTDGTVQDSIRRIGREQIDKAIEEIDDPRVKRQEAVHQVRKRCKKLRALVRLVRPALGADYKRENVRFRDIARNLAAIRDEQSRVETLERLLSGLEDSERAGFDPVLDKLRNRRDSVSSGQDPEALLTDARQALETARFQVDHWCLDTDGVNAVCGLKKTYKRSRKSARRAFRTGAASDFHEWRKRVKYHTHHLSLLRPLWPRVHRSWQREAKALADMLGHDHDLALLDDLLESEGAQLAADAKRKSLQKIIHREQQHLRKEAWAAGQRLHAEKPGALTKRLRRYWHTWQEA